MSDGYGNLRFGNKPNIEVEFEDGFVSLTGASINGEYRLSANEAVYLAKELLKYFETEKPETLVEMYQRNFRQLRSTAYLNDDHSAEMAFRLLKIELGLHDKT